VAINLLLPNSHFFPVIGGVSEFPCCKISSDGKLRAAAAGAKNRTCDRQSDRRPNLNSENLRTENSAISGGRPSQFRLSLARRHRCFFLFHFTLLDQSDRLADAIA
jgi:hypothetical protein